MEGLVYGFQMNSRCFFTSSSQAEMACASFRSWSFCSSSGPLPGIQIYIFDQKVQWEATKGKNRADYPVNKKR